MAPPGKEQPDPRKRFSVGGLLTYGAIVMVCYFFSIGPVVMLSKSGQIPQTAWPLLEGIYAPVEWLYDHTPLRRPIEWYVGVWMNKPGAKK